MGGVDFPLTFHTIQKHHTNAPPAAWELVLAAGTMLWLHSLRCTRKGKSKCLVASKVWCHHLRDLALPSLSRLRQRKPLVPSLPDNASNLSFHIKEAELKNTFKSSTPSKKETAFAQNPFLLPLSLPQLLPLLQNLNCKLLICFAVLL